MSGTTRDSMNSYIYETVHVQSNEEIIKDLEERVRIQQLLNALGEAGTDGNVRIHSVDQNAGGTTTINCDGCSVDTPYLLVLL